MTYWLLICIGPNPVDADWHASENHQSQIWRNLVASWLLPRAAGCSCQTPATLHAAAVALDNRTTCTRPEPRELPAEYGAPETGIPVECEPEKLFRVPPTSRPTRTDCHTIGERSRLLRRRAPGRRALTPPCGRHQLPRTPRRRPPRDQRNCPHRRR